jgi:hypothetical protein
MGSFLKQKQSTAQQDNSFFGEQVILLFLFIGIMAKHK